MQHLKIGIYVWFVRNMVEKRGWHLFSAHEAALLQSTSSNYYNRLANPPSGHHWISDHCDLIASGFCIVCLVCANIFTIPDIIVWHALTKIYTMIFAFHTRGMLWACKKKLQLFMKRIFDPNDSPVTTFPKLWHWSPFGIGVLFWTPFCLVCKCSCGDKTFFTIQKIFSTVFFDPSRTSVDDDLICFHFDLMHNMYHISGGTKNINYHSIR